ncbi:MAG: hypothetical protein LBP93_08225 [Treponema sp.]|jgi:hypothetical protein|nr:hypothetical protein [Treponema sp.]
MKTLLFLLIFPLIGLFSCAGGPAETSSVQPGDEPGLEEGFDAPVAEAPEAEDNFDPGSITQEVFDSTKIDVQRLIEDLNSIIRSRDYMAWVSYLGGDYFEAISSPEYLNRISNSARLKAQKIVLQSPNAYFTHVVVPSRANDRVDDIEFVSQRRVKAFTITEKGQRLRLYDLEKSEEGWKIIN